MSVSSISIYKPFSPETVPSPVWALSHFQRDGQEQPSTPQCIWVQNLWDTIQDNKQSVLNGLHFVLLFPVLSLLE